MSKLLFYAKKLKTFDFRNISRIAKRVHEEHSRPYLLTMADIIWCAAKYQAAPTDYLQSDMFRLSHEQRTDIITAGASSEFVKRNCDLSRRDMLENKFNMYEKFSDFLGRKYFFVNEAAEKNDFDAFVKTSNLDEILVKPATETGGGRGVRKFKSADEAWDYAVSIAPAIAEEVLTQDARVAALNPSSINTVRPLTLYRDGKISFLAIFFRIGAGGLVDNFCDGGMVTPVNIETGVIEYPAADENVNYYEIHPITGAPIVGFEIPYFEQIKEMITKAALMIPELGYVGWDVALTPEGPVIIEGNLFASHAFFNFAGQHPDGKYFRHEFEEKMGWR
ncbi:MAG: hypothetical protein IKE52_00715 [Mogibacterium sp.]|nr:hypothetical protein [Mogibacterium sp.]